ncbi:MAG: Ig-like domain-containing protein [Deltaproteobacteria bacterium]|nr:Ig-like domain-containing protein [Deltaproteobacteria bacterium]
MRRLALIAAASLLWGACDEDSPSRPDTDVSAPDADASAPDSDASPDAPALEVDTGPVARPYPEPGAFVPERGPGGPVATFAEADLGEHCAYLDGGPADTSDHHNLVVMYDGYLLMPWAPEFGQGGITLWDISDPCTPVVAGMGTSIDMRETHAIGFSSIGGQWAVTDGMRFTREDDEELIFPFPAGVLFWDLSDISEPKAVARVDLPGVVYPDAYARVSLSVFWQAPYVYVAGSDNGVFILDATDPREPVLVNQITFDPVLRAGKLDVIGNLLIVSTTEGPRTVLLDISDPANAQPIPGGDFLVKDSEGTPREPYFSNHFNGFLYYARKDSGGGPIIYDIRDPTHPTFVGDAPSPGAGGYVYVKDDLLFMGESNFAGLYDISDQTSPELLTTWDLQGDLDTATPIGNLVVLSVDDGAKPNEGSAIAAWDTMPDTRPPRVTWAWPADGATDLPLTSRLGLSFSEFISVQSAWEGSVRVYEADTDPALTRVDGWVSVQEATLNFWPQKPLRPGTRYVLEVPAGGIQDYNGNAIAEAFMMHFTTAGSR